MEEAALSDKPWQLKGEVSASVRPENSLLQEQLEYDQTTRLAPVITEETTLKLEDIIKQRIKDKSWDDVERKEKPKESATEYKKRIVLDQEKSKQSLSQVYEQEFLRQTQVGGSEGSEEEEKEDPEREEIQKALSALFIKLDALSNFRYTPKQAAPDVKIVSNLPAVTVEEVAPTSVSHAAQLAPEEIQSKKKEQKGETEKTATDRKRARRDKKKKQGEKRKAEEQKDKQVEGLGLHTKYSKEKAKRDLEKQSKMGKDVTVIKEDKKAKSGLTSSKQFFSQLQEEVTSQISAKKLAKRKKSEKKLSSSKYKL
ncbi:hypothetical protein CAPTEDRAFT_166848 [Capitella teleta]|uniref:Uncharacterized protein n=1 Tax=Capitella teleta TaxID=283909 RepID=R7V3B3_CAPTE|nr:hypothetical protein CAPTEDRAFT_166848 [Capitella teleta]|eukprot:ELU13333.1 hypothetical protein CAPTEDRAFT_166848 [Capitella teleta]